MSINTNVAKFVKKALYKNNAPVVYLFVLRRLARKCTKFYNACRAIVRLIKPFVLRQVIESRFAAVVLTMWTYQCSVCHLNQEIIEKSQANKAVQLVVFHTGKDCSVRPWIFPEILIEWKKPLEFVNFGKCSSIRQFEEIQTTILHRMESAIDFSLHGACFLNCFSLYH